MKIDLTTTFKKDIKVSYRKAASVRNRHKCSPNLKLFFISQQNKLPPCFHRKFIHHALPFPHGRKSCSFFLRSEGRAKGQPNTAERGGGGTVVVKRIINSHFIDNKNHPRRPHHHHLGVWDEAFWVSLKWVGGRWQVHLFSLVDLFGLATHSHAHPSPQLEPISFLNQVLQQLCFSRGVGMVFVGCILWFHNAPNRTKLSTWFV